MLRDIFSDEHEHFRAEFRRFVEAEIEPKVAGWNEAGITDKATWKLCGEHGFLGASAPEEHGGGGGDYLYEAVIMEELSRVRAHALMLSLHSDICMPYLIHYASPEQKQRFLAPAISGDCVLAIAHWDSKAARDQKDDRRDATVRAILDKHAQTCEITVIGEFEEPEWQVVPATEKGVGDK